MKRTIVLLAGLLVLFLIGAQAQQAPIPIGFYSPVTGPAAADGQSALAGAQIAVDAINKAGGVLGRPVKLVSYDDHFSPDEAATITRRLIEQDHVAAIVSGSYSFTTRAGAPIAEQNHVPFLAAYAVHPSITEVGKYVFRVGTLATLQGAAGAELVANKLGLKDAAVLVVNNDFGTSLADAFDKQYKADGGTIAMQAKYPLGETDFRPLISKISRAHPDVIYAIGYYSEAASFVRELRNAGITTQVVGQEGYDSPTFISLAGKAANGVIITTEFNRDSNRAVVHEFMQAYQQKTGKPADAVSATCYDAVRLVANAIERAGSTDPQKIIEALQGTQNFDQAVSGPIYGFSTTRDAIRPIAIQIVKDGHFHYYSQIDERNLQLK